LLLLMALVTVPARVRAAARLGGLRVRRGDAQAATAIRDVRGV
jgi:hypothetical protein